MAGTEEIKEKMKMDWERRIAHDYRFWMSDGYQSDESMWASGERDFDIILSDYSRERGSIVEIGCGVGRLIRAAASRFNNVYGVDVAANAIAKAESLLRDCGNVNLFQGNGADLGCLSDESIDLVISFAAFTSMPAEIMCAYFRESWRVLKPGGEFRFQAYIGSFHKVAGDDTLHLRCYSETALRETIGLAGFDVSEVRELKLPFQVSFEELGIKAVLVTASKQSNSPPAEVNRMLESLLPTSQSSTEILDASPDLECWMALNYARELATSGQIHKAKETIAYARQCVGGKEDSLHSLIAEVEGIIEEESSKQTRKATGSTISTVSGEHYEANLKALEHKFPAIYRALQSVQLNPSSVEMRDSQQGNVIYLLGSCQDHATKPIASARTWVERSLTTSKTHSLDPSKKAQEGLQHLAVVGMGAGYHIEELLSKNDFNVSVIEPSWDVFVLALQARDIRDLLSRISFLQVGEVVESDFMEEVSELLIRPQVNALHSEYCNDVKQKFYGARGLALLNPSIAVLGPMQGGTLPMTAYCHRALTGMGARTKMLDVSNFVHGYHGVGNLISDQFRQASMQGAYLEMISQILLEAFEEKPVDILICMAQAPISGRALTELRKRGVTTVLWFVEDYLRFTYWQDMAQYYDFIFTIQKGECLEKIKQAGAMEVHYLPTACDPDIHRPVELSEEEKAKWGSPISFVGAGYHNRQQMFAALAHLPFKIWGTEWPVCRPFDKMVQANGARISPDDYVKIFNGTDVNLNLHSSSERDGVDPFGDFLNPRTFELASCGAFQLIDERTLLPEAFKIGDEVTTFKDIHELKEKYAYFINSPEERREISARARERALAEHTYQHRLTAMLKIIYSRMYERLQKRVESNPWPRMIRRVSSNPELKLRCLKAFQEGREAVLETLIADIMQGSGELTETEKKLLFLHHVRSQIIYMRNEETAGRTRR